MDQERRLLKAMILKKSTYFKYLDMKVLDEIVRSMHKIKYPANSTVMDSSQTPTHLYVFAEGKVVLKSEKKYILTMPPWSVYGEQEILFKKVRQATATAIKDSTVWQIRRSEFKDIIRRLSPLNENPEFLSTVEVFRKYNEEALKRIQEEVQVEFVKTDEPVPVRSDTLYVVSSGLLRITSDDEEDGEGRIINVLKKGDHFDGGVSNKVFTFFPGVELLKVKKEVLRQFDDERAPSPAQNEKDKVLKIKEFSNIEFEDLSVVNTIGAGAYGRVELVRYMRKPGVSFALKKIPKTHIVKKSQQDYVVSESSILLKSNNPFITRCYSTFRDDKYVYMLLEVCLGGDLARIMNRYIYFEEDVAKFICGCVVEAFEYLHKNHIIYRDLKPENLVIDRRGYVKLTDFGLSKQLGYTGRALTYCGTAEYFSPEMVLNLAHDRGVDFWTLGIVIYELLSGNLPFSSDDILEVFEGILEGIEEVYFSVLVREVEAEDLVRKLCRREPEQRIGYKNIDQIRQHKWFQEFDWAALKSQTLPAPSILIPELRDSFDSSHFDIVDFKGVEPPPECSNWDMNF